MDEEKWSALCCPITLTPMIDPVILTTDGHTYERSAITHWLSSNSTSPCTGVKVDGGMLVSNHALRNTIEEVRKEAGGFEEFKKSGRGPTAVATSIRSNEIPEGKDDIEDARARVQSFQPGKGAKATDDIDVDLASESPLTAADSKKKASGYVDGFKEGSLTSANFSSNADQVLAGAMGTNHWAERYARENAEKKKNERDRVLSQPVTADEIVRGAKGTETVGSYPTRQRRTADWVVVGGSSNVGSGSMGSTGCFEHVQPYPGRISSEEGAKCTKSQFKVLTMDTATMFPGLVATGGHGKDVLLWNWKPKEDVEVKKPEVKKRFSFAGFSRVEKEEEKAQDDGGYWQNFTSLKGPKDWVHTLSMSDDAQLVMAGTRKGSIHLWKSPDMGPMAGEWEKVQDLDKAHDGGEFNAGVVNAVKLFHDKRRAISGGLDWSVKLWDIREGEGVVNGKVLGSATHGHSAPIRDISVYDQNDLFASAADDGRVLVWDSRVSGGAGEVARLNVCEKPVSGCMFEPHGLNGGGNWIITSDEEGRIKQYDLRKWEVSRVIYDSELVHRNDDYGGSKTTWEGGKKIDIFTDVQISTEGWVCAATQSGHLYSWDPAREWNMCKQPTNIKATCLTIARIMA
ncbi:hypothetical protein TrVE_jg1697 [Triparma verrucosa]|uniref:U-box domain-containing protein n=1 Tax=Triparma verrucosa TaxID=1606542 RepID=A0A9W7B7N4_9STRA|nr:hypothetical protein TrVE_jg1697 [Triparma verrucosa]